MSWVVFNLFLIILVIAVLIVVWFEAFRKNDLIFGDRYRVQSGVLEGGADTFQTNNFDLYLGRSSSQLNLTISASNKNIVGRSLVVKNKSGHQITLVAGPGLKLTPSTGLTLFVNTVAFLVVEGQANNLVRIK